MKTKTHKRRRRKTRHKKSFIYKYTGGGGGRRSRRNSSVKKASLSLKANCSPKPRDEINEFSCYTNDNLLYLRNNWNARHPDAKITTNSPREIHRQLSNYLKDVCHAETCWLKQKDAFGKLDSNLENSFAPVAPEEWKKNPNEWLSSVDIMKVMKQYERAYKCFDFMGPTPINFDSKKLYGECVWEELCKFNLKNHLKRGKTKIGIIFNTDPDYKSGQHWISMFVNIKKKTIFFFDSTGDPAPPEVMTLVERIQKQGRALKPPLMLKFDSNEGVEHQNGNTECGIYSIFFIAHMLEDTVNEHYMKTHILSDQYMEKFRKVYFN